MTYAATVRAAEHDTKTASINGAVTALLRTIAERDRARDLVTQLEQRLARVEKLLAHARAVSPSARQVVYVVDVQAAIDGEQ